MTATETAPGTLRRAAAAFGFRHDHRPLLAVALVAALVAAPVAALFAIAAGAEDNIWPHVVGVVLPNALLDTAGLLVGVGLLVILAGVPTAWLVATCRFPGQAVFDWALLLPLAMPTYIIAYCYVDLLDSFGPVQGALRHVFGFTSRRDYWFPEIRSLYGAVFVMGMVLYPYVYLCARAVFLMQSAAVFDVARTLGASRWAVFLRVAVPLARPAVAVGVALALMETLNDIGASEYLGVRSLSVAVYATWVNRGSLAGAAQIACVMLVVVLAVVLLERFGRRHQRYVGSAHRWGEANPVQLTGLRACGAVLACLLPLALGFLVPAGFLLREAVALIASNGIGAEFLVLIRHSVTLAGSAAAIACVLGFLLAHAEQHARGPAFSAIVRLTGLGYALPGTVLAIGAMVALVALDNAIDAAMRTVFGIPTGLLIMGSGGAVIYAYVVRFLAVAVGTMETGFHKISPHLEMAARTLGQSRIGALVAVELPLMRPAVATAALLVFVDAMKELPATLLLRPFDFETLSTSVYGYAARGSFEQGAVAALAIVVAGFLPVLWLARTSRIPLPEQLGAPDAAIKAQSPAMNPTQSAAKLRRLGGLL
ncbi:MAG: ABC transporter permease [Xanthobacteraceae bacterium]